jgi:hypothetical protein
MQSLKDCEGFQVSASSCHNQLAFVKHAERFSLLSSPGSDKWLCKAANSYRFLCNSLLIIEWKSQITLQIIFGRQNYNPCVRLLWVVLLAVITGFLGSVNFVLTVDVLHQSCIWQFSLFKVYIMYKALRELAVLPSSGDWLSLQNNHTNEMTGCFGSSLYSCPSYDHDNNNNTEHLSI